MKTLGILRLTIPHRVAVVAHNAYMEALPSSSMPENFAWERAILDSFRTKSEKGKNEFWLVGGRYASDDFDELVLDIRGLFGKTFADPWRGKSKYVSRGLGVKMVLPSYGSMEEVVTAKAFYRKLSTLSEKCSQKQDSVWFVSDMSDAGAWAKSALLETLSEILGNGAHHAIVFHAGNLLEQDGIRVPDSVLSKMHVPNLLAWNEWFSSICQTPSPEKSEIRHRDAPVNPSAI